MGRRKKVDKVQKPAVIVEQIESPVVEVDEKPSQRMYTRTVDTNCPRCGSNDTLAVRSVPVQEGSSVRIQYRKCQRGVCRHNFKAAFQIEKK